MCFMERSLRCKGIGPGDIHLKELMERLQQDVDEVIVATTQAWRETTRTSAS